MNMYRFIRDGLMVCLLACASLGVSLPAFAGGGGYVSEKSMTEETTSAEKSMTEETTSAEKSVAEETMPAEKSMAEETMPAEKSMAEETTPAEAVSLVKDTDVSIYGRFWPKVTYKDNGGSSTDITDALSRVGLKADTRITDTLSAVLHGEWDVDIEANGDFGDARQAYVGIQSSQLGFVGIGKQWDPYFNVVAEVTDIFYHRSSPFGYDNEGPFRSNNLVRYANSLGSLNVDFGLQVNGSPENNAGEGFFRTNANTSSDSDNVDAVSAGVSYGGEMAYVGVSYLRQNRDDDGVERNYFGVGASLNMIENLYLAVTYQYIQDNYDDGTEANPYTVDVAGALSFDNGIKVLGGFFAQHEDDGSNCLSGFNFTLIKEVHPSTDVFVEWVLTNHKQKDTVNTASLGFRYDFDVAIF